MIVYPNAKINLGLRIINKRTDGYHTIESIFYPIPLTDLLEISRVEGNGDMTLVITGIEVPGGESDNVLFRCYELIADEREVPSLECHLHKQIPIGAGLGGGSSDAAFFLKKLNKLLDDPLSDTELKRVLQRIGSDCSFFLENRPVFVEGTGTILSESNLDLTGYFLTLVYPGIHVSTAEAYSGCQPTGIRLFRDNPDLMDPTVWPDVLVNDFEPDVFKKHPVLGTIKSELYTAGALYASMSGSGSTIYGLSEGPLRFKRNPDYTYFECRL